MKKTIYLLTAIVLFTSCSNSAHIVKTWRDPAVTVNVDKLNKVLVMSLLKNETYRRVAEDQLVAMLQGKGVASYNYFPAGIPDEKENEIKQRLKQDGFDGAIVTRVVDVDKDVNYVPGSFNNFPVYYGRFWGYYRNSWNNYYEPGYYEKTKKYTVETNVYSFKRDKLIWSGVTSTVDPDNAEKLMHGVSKAIFKEMKAEKFIVN